MWCQARVKDTQIIKDAQIIKDEQILKDAQIIKDAQISKDAQIMHHSGKAFSLHTFSRQENLPPKNNTILSLRLGEQKSTFGKWQQAKIT